MNVLEKAIKERNDYIKKHPHLKEYQKEIDFILDKVGSDPETRLEALAIMAEGKSMEAQINMNLLKEKLKEMQDGKD